MTGLAHAGALISSKMIAILGHYMSLRFFRRLITGKSIRFGVYPK